MATKKDLFDDGKKDKLLKEAIKKAKTKKTEKFPCVFGMGKGGAMFVLDWKRQNDHGKLFLEMKGRHEKVIKGQARISGDLIEITIEDTKGGKIKPKDVKDCLKQSSPIKKAKLFDKDGSAIADEEEESQQ